MINEKEMTAPVVSVGADTEQSSQNLTDNRVVVFSAPLQGHVLHCRGCCGSV